MEQPDFFILAIGSPDGARTVGRLHRSGVYETIVYRADGEVASTRAEEFLGQDVSHAFNLVSDLPIKMQDESNVWFGLGFGTERPDLVQVDPSSIYPLMERLDLHVKDAGSFNKSDFVRLVVRASILFITILICRYVLARAYISFIENRDKFGGELFVFVVGLWGVPIAGFGLIGIFYKTIFENSLILAWGCWVVAVCVITFLTFDSHMAAAVGSFEMIAGGVSWIAMYVGTFFNRFIQNTG